MFYKMQIVLLFTFNLKGKIFVTLAGEYLLTHSIQISNKCGTAGAWGFLPFKLIDWFE